MYAENKRAYFQAHPKNVPKDKRIDERKVRQADGGQHVESSHGGDRLIQRTDEVAESLKEAKEDRKHLQE